MNHNKDTGISAPELAVIVPTYNELENIARLVEILGKALKGIAYEIIFVDDNSPDGSSDEVRRISSQSPHVRCIQRIGRRGLSSAVIEGMLATSATFAAVIDGDLQHDETILPDMLKTLRQGDVDIAVGSRYVDGGGTGDWDARRLRMSRFATTLSQKITGASLSDPMSGFFMLRTEVLRAKASDLTGVGYKILLDILSAPGPKLRVAEIGYQFRSREAGQSKLDNRVLLEFVEMLIARSVGKYVPTKFVMFSIVGALGVVVHMVVLSILFQKIGLDFATAQAFATLVAMTANFFVNNVFTYFDKRLTGWRMLRGWLSFCLASSVGAIANVGVAVYLFENVDAIWFASALAGVVVGATWNYAVTALYTWKN